MFLHPFSMHSLKSRRTMRHLFYVIVATVTIVTMAVPFRAFQPAPKPVHAQQTNEAPPEQPQIVIAAVVVASVTSCAIGAATSGVIYGVRYGVYGSEDAFFPNTGEIVNPDAIVAMGIGCAAGIVFVLAGVEAAIGGFATWLAGTITTDIAPWIYDVYIAPHNDEIIAAFESLATASDGSPVAMNGLIIDEFTNSPGIHDGIEQMWTDYDTYIEPAPGLPNVPLPVLDVIEPAGNVIYNMSPVSAEIIVPPPNQISVCAEDSNNDGIPDEGTGSEVNYVQFGYATSPNQGSVVILPGPDAPDAKDWYGCNGWGIRFDVLTAGISSPTPIYLAARVEDMYGSLSSWYFSSQITADPRGQHDYSVSTWGASNTTPNVGDTIQVTATVRNAGASAETNQRVELYVDDVFKNSYYLSPLSAGQSTQASFNWIAQQGAHTIRIESDLTNDAVPANDSASGVVIVGTAPALSVNGSTSPSAFLVSATTQGLSSTFYAGLQNDGSASTNVTVSKGGSRASWIGLSETSFTLAANRSKSFAFTVSVPSGMATGTYAAEIYFDWTGGSRITLPIQIVIGAYQNGNVTHNFSTSSAAINGTWSSTRTSGWYTGLTLDNYTSTSESDRFEELFDLSSSEYSRLDPAGTYWYVNVHEVESETSSTGLYFRVNGFNTTKTSSYSGNLTVAPSLAVGPNTWRISITNALLYGNDTIWNVTETQFIMPFTQSAWMEDYNPGESTVNEWKAGLDYARICGTVTSVPASGYIDLYNNGVKVDDLSLNSSDVGDEVCWEMSKSEISGSNRFNLKARLNAARVNLSNLHFAVHYFTGTPSLQVTRTLSASQANVGQNVTATLTFLNNGSNVADEPWYQDSLPSGLQLTSGSLSGDPGDILPGATEIETYVFRGTIPGAYTIPNSPVTYEDFSNNEYQTTLNASTIEIWGGTLQPVIDDVTCSETGQPLTVQATVTDSLTGSAVNDATVIATITLPDTTPLQVALAWDAPSSHYRGVYYPSQAGVHRVVADANKAYYTDGTSAQIECRVTGANVPPEANAQALPNHGPAPLTTTLDASASVDVDGVITDYEWDVDNNGSTDLTGRSVDHVFADEGNYTVTLTVTDDQGGQDTDTVVVSVGSYVPPACYTLSLSGTNGPAPTADPANSAGCNAGEYVEDEGIVLTAHPDSDWHVSAWTGTDDDNSTALTNTLTMPAASHAASVTYAENGGGAYPLTEEFDDPDLFTQTVPDVYVTDGKVYWTVSRDPAGYEQYVYRSIPEFSGDVRVTVTGQVDSYTNNCQVQAGVGKAGTTTVLDGATALTFGFTGGGCATNGPFVGVAGASMDYAENSCNFTGPWQWISLGTPYTAEFTISDGTATLSVPGSAASGPASGTPTYSGPYDTLYVGMTGSGDWPSCSGTIESIVIEPLESGGSISGYVYDSGSGLPIENAWVSVDVFDTFQGITETNTGPDGSYALHGLPPGDYRLRAGAQDYANALFDHVPYYGDHMNATRVTLANPGDHFTGADFSLDPGGTISGTVYADSDGTPLEGVPVDTEPGGFGTCTDENGNFMMEGLPLDTPIILVAGGSGWGGCSNDGTYARKYWPDASDMNSATPVTLNSGGGEHASGIDFTMTPGGTVSGTVSAEGGAVLANIGVSADFDGWGSGACTDENGVYTISGLPQDIPFRVHSGGSHWCSGDQSYAQQYWDHVTNWDAATVLTATSGSPDIAGIDFTLSSGGSVAGIVYADDGITPLANIGVNADFGGWGNGDCTDNNGRYTISGIPLDTPFRVSSGGNHWCTGPKNYVTEYWQEVQDWGAATVLTATSGMLDFTGINFTLEIGGSISGYVYDELGTPLSGVPIDTGSGGYGRCTNGDGSFMLSGLPLDTPVTIRAGGAQWGGCPNQAFFQEYYQDAFLESDATPFVLDSGTPDISGIMIYLDNTGGTISGHLTNGDTGQPLANGYVDVAILYYRGDDNADYQTAGMGVCADENGDYTLSLPLWHL